MNDKKKKSSIFGFLTVAGDAESGFVGGCLLLNERGRPVEFHCTAPVRPNRAQVILYGSTLRSFVVGEQISVALLAKAKVRPVVVWTDDPDVLAGREPSQCPMAQLIDKSAGYEASHSANRSQPTNHLDDVVEVDEQNVALVHPSFSEDKTVVRAIADQLKLLDLREPFERIQDAIAEAIKGNAKAAA